MFRSVILVNVLKQDINFLGGLLKSLLVPTQTCEDILIDFVEVLPKSHTRIA